MPLGTMALDQGDIEGADALLRAGLQIYLELEFDAALPLAFEQFAAVAVARRDASHAVQLAAAGAAWREKLCTNPTPYTPWLVAHLAAAHVAVDPGALMGSHGLFWCSDFSMAGRTRAEQRGGRPLSGKVDPHSSLALTSSGPCRTSAAGSTRPQAPQTRGEIMGSHWRVSHSYSARDHLSSSVLESWIATAACCCHGQWPSISTTSAQLRNVPTTTSRPSAARASSVGSRATVRMMSAATRDLQAQEQGPGQPPFVLLVSVWIR